MYTQLLVKISTRLDNVIYNNWQSTKSFKIIKLKDYDGNSHEEEIFLKGLFFGGTKEVTTMDLYDHFYITLDRIKASLNKKENKEKILKKCLPSFVP